MRGRPHGQNGFTFGEIRVRLRCRRHRGVDARIFTPGQQPGSESTLVV
jgi:hypothetical protein